MATIPGVPSAPIDISPSEALNDTEAGLMLIFDAKRERQGLFADFLLGGFGIGSDLFYEFNGAIGYQWNKAIGTVIGYRMLDVDYEDGGFAYDARQQGWQVGLTWAF